jgi:aryl-alcohol dehydrogenase-like predicted oxidoreductase
MTMQQRRLGTTGVWVSELRLGTMMFGEWGTKDHDQSIRINHRALDAGVTFADTADVYSAGESEVIVGKALAGRRDRPTATPPAAPSTNLRPASASEKLPATTAATATR